MTIQQWFTENFFKARKPEFEVKIPGMDQCGKYEFTRAYVPTDLDGSLFVYCGGPCIIGFELNNVAQDVVYLVIESGAHRQDGDKRDRLRLVYSV